MKAFRNGLLTGLFLQLAIGPIFFFILNLTLQKTMMDGFAATIGVMLADYVYITLAIFGVGELLKRNRVKKIFGITSSLILIVFGLFIIGNILGSNGTMSIDQIGTNLLSSFSTTFFLTISSPMTILLWTSLFATKAIEYNYTRRQVIFFGIGTGFATMIFMGSSVIVFSLIKHSVPTLLIQILNLAVGILLILYGGIRLWRGMSKNI